MPLDILHRDIISRIKELRRQPERTSMGIERRTAGLPAETNIDISAIENTGIPLEDDSLDELEEALKGAVPGAPEPEEEMPEKPRSSYPSCERHRCFSCIDGKCMALEDNDFDSRGCPFYKPFEQARREQKECFRQLVENGRTDLIHKYRKFLIGMDIFDLADDGLADIFMGLKAYETEGMESVLDTSEDDDWE